jgi:deoxyadenosine/deoxycytidine kinase
MVRMSPLQPNDQETHTNQTIVGPILVLIRGLPGSGKSYLAAKLQEQIGSDRVILLDPDTIDYTDMAYTTLSKSLHAAGVEEKFHPNRFLKAKAHAAVTNHKIIIWNQPFSDAWGFERTVDNIRTFATEQNITLPILLVELEIDHDLAKQRIAKRREEGGRGPSVERFTRFISDYTSLADKGYKTVIVRGDGDVAVSAGAVLSALRQL